MQHVVDPGELARALDGLHVQRLLHHADEAVVALLSVADRARVLVGDVETDATENRALLQLLQGARQLDGNSLVATQQVVGQPRRGLWADAG